MGEDIVLSSESEKILIFGSDFLSLLFRHEKRDKEIDAKSKEDGQSDDPPKVREEEIAGI